MYRARRAELTRLAQEHTYDRPIAVIDYTPEEIETWGAVWDKMEGLWDLYACKEYKKSLQLMKEHCGYSRDSIPQQRDISDFLKKTTNFQMRPVAGLLSLAIFSTVWLFVCSSPPSTFVITPSLCTRLNQIFVTSF